MFSTKRRIIGGSILLVIVAVAATFYWLVLPGLSSARSEPPGIEVAVATWLLHQSVPEELRARKNPLGSDPADVAAGRDLFRQKCELCHAYDGGGKTQIGGDEYPRPPSLRTAIASMSDGEVFYHIHNGIRIRCLTSRFGNWLLISAICRKSLRSLRWRRPPRRAGEGRRRTMSARRLARSVTKPSIPIGAGQEWRTWCAIHVSTPMLSFPICRAPMSFSISPRTTSPLSTAAAGSSATSRK